MATRLLVLVGAGTYFNSHLHSPRHLLATGAIMIAGLTGSIVLKDSRLSDILSDLQGLLRKQAAAGESSNSGSDNSAAIASQVRRLAQEVRELAASRSITVLNGSSGQSGNLSALVVPVAALGAMGYGYMWWKGWSFSDWMYVTRRNIANVAASFNKQLDNVSSVLAATKRHLTQRLENVDSKLDEQKEMSKLIKDEVFEVRGDLTQIGFDIDAIQKMVSGLEGKIVTLEDKQDFANAGVWYLCQFVGGMKDGTMPQFIQDFPAKARIERPAPQFTDGNSLKGLQYIADTIQSGTIDNTNVKAILQNDISVSASKTIQKQPSN